MHLKAIIPNKNGLKHEVTANEQLQQPHCKFPFCSSLLFTVHCHVTTHGNSVGVFDTLAHIRDDNSLNAVIVLGLFGWWCRLEA